MPSDLSPLWISLKTALLATIATFFLGITAAYWMLNYRGKGKLLLEGILISPLILPPTVLGFLLLLLFGKNGAIGKVLAYFNLSVVFTWYGAVIAAIVVSFPLMYRVALGAFEQVDTNFLDVARTLGASEWTIFRRILIPLSLPGILAGTMLTFARALGEFGATLMLAGNIPGETQTIPMAIYFAVEAGATNEAGFWAIAILCISMSGIVAVNFWQAQGKSLKQRKKIERWRERPSESPSPFLVSHSSALIVDIQKQLHHFPLNISFSADQDPLGMLGGSGAGKSMILRCIAGVETPTQGQIVLNGRVLFNSERKINLPSRDRRIGFLVQNYALFPHMTVAQNIAFSLPKMRSQQVQQQVSAQLAAMQLAEYGDRYPHQLSGGQQQRVALARALASQPEALLLDEPFSALDTFLRSQLEQHMITQLTDYPGVTLFVTHNLEEAYRVCPNLLVLHQGQAIAQGAKQAIFDRPETYTVAQLTGCKNFSRAVALSSTQIEAIDWGIQLQVAEPIPRALAYVGIRAHQIIFVKPSVSDRLAPNLFPCWLAKTSETPHRMTIFLKFNSASIEKQDYHLQAEVFKETWLTLKNRPHPWYVKLDPLRLILMKA
ncbi:MAG: molybdate ABC transporter permease subunit [Timaviella obliquedivisa GSE-PSE-MK23-08B]|jgi:molybdate transport system permease protein|nr:molybdate ABC transporter permease subunit [Timaviella obliquedivisa GSE-PSE-MK23-08B]